MGEVFIAKTPWPEAPLAALKRLRPDVAGISSFSERFLHEALLAVRLSHPNLVNTLDVGSVGEQLYVVSELIAGRDVGFVSDRLRERGVGGPVSVAVRLLLDALLGLAYVHGVSDEEGQPLNLIHRDITPGNLLIGEDGQVKIADFGLAKSSLNANLALTQHGELLGTPAYLAPEVVETGQASQASDIYGLGAVAYRFLTGVSLFSGKTADVLIQVVRKKPRPLASLRPDLPDWFVGLIEAMLSKNPKLRPSDALKLREALIEEAQTADLLVPKEAVGRWLSRLFEAELGEEAALRRAWLQAPAVSSSDSEGTVVLAVRGQDELLALPSEAKPSRLSVSLEALASGTIDFDHPDPTMVSEASKRLSGLDFEHTRTRSVELDPRLLERYKRNRAKRAEPRSRRASYGLSVLFFWMGLLLFGLALGFAIARLGDAEIPEPSPVPVNSRG